MFSAYKIGIRLSLINDVSAGLGVISQHLRRTDGDVKALHKSLGLLGGVMAGVGVAGVAMVGKMLKPAEEYTSQLQKMNMAGMKQAEVADAVGAAKVAADGADIVVRAAQDGNADWALRFGEEANDNLTELYLSITAEWVAAAENFTGEKRLLFESFEGYCSRINSALDDLGSLTAMMRRNGVLFVGP